MISDVLNMTTGDFLLELSVLVLIMEVPDGESTIV